MAIRQEGQTILATIMGTSQLAQFVFEISMFLAFVQDRTLNN
jgi:hypothetical protein